MPYKRLYRGDFHRARREHPDWPSLVSEGDSWFSYELRGNIIDRLDDPRDTALPADQQHWALLRLEQSGDTITEILSAGQRAYLRDRVLEQFEGIDALLLSAGGNDIIGPEMGELLRDFQDGDVPIEDRFHQDKLRRTLGVIRALLLDLIDLCASIQPQLEIYVHGYDYPKRLGVPARLFKVKVAGPWILPSFKDRGYDGKDALQAEMLRYLVDSFNELLADLTTDHERFHHVDLRGVVGDEWADEIHPNREGAMAVAAKLRRIFKARFPNLI